MKMTKDEILMNENEGIIGVYSGDSMVFDTLQNFRNIILRINTDKSFEIDNSILQNISDKENVLLTIEFRGNKFFTYFKNDPLEKIINGSFDKKLELVYEKLLKNNNKIFIRINPEMEVPVNKYQWQNKHGGHYIEAYRYIVNKLKIYDSNLNFVWGPVGFMGMEEYYPGEDVVNYISIVLKSETEGLYKRYPTYSDLQDEIHKKFHRLRFFNHPTIVIGQSLESNRTMVFDLINSEKDTINKYRHIAYDESLWTKSNVSVEKENFIIGLYDPLQKLTHDLSVSAEHLFVDFRHVQSGEFKHLLDSVLSRNHDVIITVEPWRDLAGKSDTAVLQNILAGKYDDIIKQIYNELWKINRPVYLRFAHEMEIPITRYTWQSQDPLTYIRAFRYFMTFEHPFPQNVSRVWGPAGDRSSLDFYPGNDVVDYISFAVYGLPDKNITDHEKQVSFSKIFNTKIWRFRLLDKPFLITEFGVKGPEDFQNHWLEDAAKTLNENRQVIGVNYFNMSDTPGAWGDIKEPDWSISNNTLHNFLSILNRNNP